MNKGFKKVLSLLMTLAMILTALPLAGVTAFAEAYVGYPDEHTSGDFRYIIWANNTVGISGYTGSAEKLNIPSKLDTYTVTSIEYGAFEGCDNLISVSIPNSVTSIGEDAFLNTGYYNNQANWQNGALYIDNCLIEAKSDKIPQNYKINEGTRVIADSAFEDCDSLTSITIPESVTNIGWGAFADCDSLASVTIPDSVANIAFHAFYCCSKLAEITVDTNNKNYSSRDGVLFNKNKTELIQYPIGNERKTYNIPDSVTSIGDSAFEDCESLTSVSIPDSVTSIGLSAFDDCINLTKITIPESVTSIEGSAFYGTGYYNNPSNWENGVLYIDNCLIEAKRDEVPQNYKINEGTRVIAGGAFFICENLTSITIPDSVTSIGEYAFEDCYSLTSITIPDSVICVGYDAFRGCNSLTEIKIGKGVTSIGDEAFIDCYNLKEIKVDANNKYYSSQDGVLFDNNKAELIQYPAGNTRTSYNIPNGVKSIGYAAFEYCDLTSITIPDSVTSIGVDAFASCDSLTSITIPDGVTNISDGVFNYCDSLTSVTIPKGVTNIGYLAFGYCHSLASVTIPESVTNIDNRAFEDCDSLTSVTIGNGVTSIGEDAFGWCDSLTSVTIPDSVTSIGESAFEFCGSLTDIYILNKDCNIVSSEDYYTIPPKTTIHGYKGSTAETFAKENGNKFVAIEGEPVTPDPDKPNAIGDIDGNANITITDAKWILQNTVKSRNLTEAQAKAADLNKDGKVTIVDAKWVLQIVVGLRDAQTLKPIKK